MKVLLTNARTVTSSTRPELASMTIQTENIRNRNLNWIGCITGYMNETINVCSVTVNHYIYIVHYLFDFQVREKNATHIYQIYLERKTVTYCLQLGPLE